MVAGRKTWSLNGGYADRIHKSAKQECITHIQNTTGILIDSPCGVGGNTNSGPLADRFFHPKNRENICAVITNKEDRENYAHLLSMFNVHLHVTQSVDHKKIVAIKQVKEQGKEIMLHLKSAFLD